MSNSQTPDKLQIVTLKRLQVLHKNKQITVLENNMVQAEIPPQLTEKFERSAATFFQEGRLTLTFITPLNIFLGLIVQFLWDYLEDFSFLTINSLISVPIPGIPSLI